MAVVIGYNLSRQFQNSDFISCLGNDIGQVIGLTDQAQDEREKMSIFHHTRDRNLPIAAEKQWLTLCTALGRLYSLYKILRENRERKFGEVSHNQNVQLTMFRFERPQLSQI